MKKVFVQKIPMAEGVCNGLLLTPEYFQRFHELVSSVLKDDYHVVTTPMDCKIVDDETKLFNVDGNEYSLSEINEIIEKAKIYDSEHK